MLSKITALLILKCIKSFLKGRPAEYVNAHRGQIAAWMLWLLLKLCNTACLISDHDPKSACLFHRYRHTCNGNICLISLMEIQHHLIIHLVNVISGKDQNIVRIVLLHIIHILKDCIGCTCVPLAATAPLVRRKDCHTAFITIQIPGNTNPDMCIKTQRLILGQHANCINP